MRILPLLPLLIGNAVAQMRLEARQAPDVAYDRTIQACQPLTEELIRDLVASAEHDYIWGPQRGIVYLTPECMSGLIWYPEGSALEVKMARCGQAPLARRPGAVVFRLVCHPDQWHEMVRQHEGRQYSIERADVRGGHTPPRLLVLGPSPPLAASRYPLQPADGTPVRVADPIDITRAPSLPPDVIARQKRAAALVRRWAEEDEALGHVDPYEPPPPLVIDSGWRPVGI